MTKVVAKLFREPEEARKAIKDLLAAGYSEREIGVLACGRRKDELEANIKPAADVGQLTAMGVAAKISSASDNLKGALAELWGVSGETVDYYQFGISSGGIVVSVHVEEARAAKARQVLRQATKSPREKLSMQVKSPGFLAASRMSVTNPVDALMSGDFRKY